MDSRPILFAAPMIRALLRDVEPKTQTRRTKGLDKLPKDARPVQVSGGVRCDDHEGRSAFVRCPYGTAGDKLWVRETWRTEERESDAIDGIRFAADDSFVPIANTRKAGDAWVVAHDNGKHGKDWRPSIFMPRWASRITLELTAVSVERVQDISEQDADREGARVNDVAALTGRDWSSMPDQRAAFAALWEHINGADSWQANPFVWVLTFRRVAQAQAKEVAGG